MIIKKNPILQTIAYVVMLFWGLSFSLSYATETIRYYAFVMYKAPSAVSTWELPPKDMETLEPGSYRFQIVRLRQEASLTGWIALRGEFEFVPDTDQGGVKLSKKETLDSSEAVNVTGSKENSLWHKTPTDNWEKGGRPWVQALIDAMRRRNIGDPDPNFMRFLVLKRFIVNQAKSDWEKQDKKYILYRLHYFPEQSLSDNEHLKALSRFIDPNPVPTTDIKTLKQWIGEQESFKKAGYLGKADEQHKEFYKGFQKASNDFLDNLVKRQAQDALTKAKSKIQEANGQIDNANDQIAKAENADNTFPKEQLIKLANDKLNSADEALNTAQKEIDKAKKKIGEDGVADVQNNFNDAKAKIETARQQVTDLGEGIDILTVIFYIFVAGVGIFLLVMLFKNLKDGRDMADEDYLDTSYQKKHHSSNKQNDLANPQNDVEAKLDQLISLDVDRQKDVAPQNDDFVGTTLDKPIDRATSDSRAVPSPQPSADYVLKKDIDGIIENLKHDLDKIAENQALAVLSTHFAQLLQGNIQQLQEDFENIIDQRIKEQLVIKLESNQAKRPDEPVQTSSNTEPISERITVELSNELRAYLERQNLFDENLWLALWRGDPSPCKLAKRLLLEYQPLTTENYDEIAAWLEKASGKQKVYLIIPTLNQECDSNLHEIVEQRIVKGAINRVLEIKRPGLGCDESVVLKAQVVSS